MGLKTLYQWGYSGNQFLCIYRYEGKDCYDPTKYSISVFSSAKKDVTSEDFFKGAVKKMVGSIRDTDEVSLYYIFYFSILTFIKCNVHVITI